MPRSSSSAAAVFVFVAVLAAAGGSIVVYGCDNVPSMSMVDACLKASTSQPLLELCHRVLLNAPDSGEVTVYAVIAAKSAQWAYEASAREAARQDAGEAQAAYAACAARYAAARSLVMAAQEQLLSCSYGSPKQELIDGKADVEACGKEIARFTAAPLFAMNAADQLKADLAYYLTGLIIGL
uniref:Pectinesterase inhibitor domain-containing protein n=1 Tax=Leersia perrieri TaxID=77586 RepID=A0A0D9X4A0_9ORYZ